MQQNDEEHISKSYHSSVVMALSDSPAQHLNEKTRRICLKVMWTHSGVPYLEK